MNKTILKIAGYLAVGLGFIGAFVPLLPTTPFLLLAVYCFSKSSPRMNDWMLRNRMFGKYLKNYEKGRGIPLAVKISAVFTMWSSITFSVILFIHSVWIILGIYIITVFVTVHIIKIKTLRSKDSILVLSATQMEIESFSGQKSKTVECEVIGIGAIEAAINTQRLLHIHKPRIVVLAGIAGTYPSSGLKISDVVMVESERDADCGSFAEGKFDAKFAKTISCPYIPDTLKLPHVASNSVNAAASPYVDHVGVDIENMEGAAVFRVCSILEVPFVEVRAISNIVGDSFDKWDIKGSVSALNETLKTLVDEV